MKWHRSLPRLSIPAPLYFLVMLLIFIHLSVGWDSALYNTLALSAHNLAEGKLWTLWTYGLLHSHASLTHLGTNCMLLLISGGRVHHMLGGKLIAALIVGGILVGGLLQVIATLITDTPSLRLIGISGGVYALVAAQCVLASESRFLYIMSGRTLLLLLTLSTSVLALMALAAPLLRETLPPDLSFMLQPLLYRLEPLFNISHPCHLGGIIVGWIIAHRAIKIPPRLKKKFLQNKV